MPNNPTSLLSKTKSTILHHTTPTKLPRIAFYISIIFLGIAALSFIITGAILGSIALASPGIVIALLLKIVFIIRQYLTFKKSPKFFHPKIPTISFFNNKSSNLLTEKQHNTTLSHNLSLEIVNDLSTKSSPSNSLERLLSDSWGNYEASSNSSTIMNLNNGIYLTIAKHNISFLLKTHHIDQINNAIIAMVNVINNSTNTTTSYTPISSLVTKECFSLSRNDKIQLKENKAIGNKWIAKGRTSKGTPVPSILIQTLSPSIENNNVNLTTILKEVKTTFINILQKANEFNCSHVQLPLLKNNDPFISEKEENTWVNGCYQMLLEAINDLPMQSPKTIQHIVLVDQNDIPSLSQITPHYCRSIAHVLKNK